MPTAKHAKRHRLRRSLHAVLTAAIVAAAVLLGPPLPAAAGPPQVKEGRGPAASSTRHVLVLNSYHIGYRWTDSMIQGIRDAFAGSGLDIEFTTVFMDMKRVSAGEAYFQELRELVAVGYERDRFEAVLACDNDALAFARLYRDELFPGVPVVFVGVNAFTSAMLDGRTDITGVVENADYLGTIELALKLRPRTRTVVVVSDNTTTGLVQRSEFERASPRLPADISVRHLSLGDTTLEGLADELARLPGSAIVLVLNSAADKSGTSYSEQQSVALLASRSTVPVFVVSDSRLGSGAMGGLVVSGYDQGRAGAGMVVSILRGTAVGTIPPMLRSPNRHMFDNVALARFGISRNALPDDSVVLNAPPSILDQYLREVIAAAVAFSIVALLVVGLSLEVLRRRRVESSLQKSEAALAGILNTVPEGIFWKDRTSTYLGCNQVYADAVGLATPGAIVGKTDLDLHWPPDWAAKVRAEDAEVIQNGQPKRRLVQTLPRADGTEIWVEKTKLPLHDEAGSVSGVLGIWDDITERRQAEAEKAKLREQLQQAMKMEAVGRLAGGVAHDFNNLLTAIGGNVEMAREELGDEGAAVRYLLEAKKASDSAAAITRQLLAFSRKQIIEPRLVNLNDLVSGLQRMLTRLIGEDIELRAALSPDAAVVRVDPGEIEQVLVNLVVNARDAMPDGGTLVIETENVELDEAYCRRNPSVSPGPFVRLAVTDSGVGMSEEVKQHLFEPFFTTKAKGRGTGLGLATIFGAVQQAGGAIDVYSEVGLGTTFKIYLPRVAGPVHSATEPLPRRLGPGHETVLLVEDDEAVRELAVAILKRLGYRVLVATAAREALALAIQTRERIDLLMTDVVLPGINGRELAERLVTIHPETRVLFTSGYTENVIVHHGIVEEHLNFIGKPYTMQGLAAKLREVLVGKDDTSPTAGAEPS